MKKTYRALRPDRVVETARRLELRIRERFPEASLADVAAELHTLAVEAQERCRSIRRPNLPLRVVSTLIAAAGLAVLVFIALTQIRYSAEIWELTNFLATLEAALGAAVFISAGVIFVITIENRIRRGRALRAIHELRAIAHIVDMHQLTKDPEPAFANRYRTEHSPVRTMTPFELSRYFDYCSELLSITSKIGALYVGDLSDPVVLTAVDEVEDLTNGLARKIWQKIMILDGRRDRGGE